MYASENWTDSAQSTYVSFKTTQIGTTTQTEKMHITDTGDVVPPTDDVGNIGLDGRRWHRVRANIVQSGDLLFENGYCVTEDKESGLLFLNQKGERIAKLDEQGNLRIRGDIIKDPTL